MANILSAIGNAIGMGGQLGPSMGTPSGKAAAAYPLAAPAPTSNAWPQQGPANFSQAWGLPALAQQITSPAPQPQPQAAPQPFDLNSLLAGANSTGGQFNVDPSTYAASQVNPATGQIDVNAVKNFYAPNQDVLARYTQAQSDVGQRGQAAAAEIARQQQFAQGQIGQLPQLYADTYDKFVAPQLAAAQSGVSNQIAQQAGGQHFNDNGSMAALQAAIGANRTSRESMTPLLQAGVGERAQAQTGSLNENLAALNAQIAAQQTGYLQQLSQQGAAAQDYATQRNAQVAAQQAEFNAQMAQQAAAANAAAKQTAATSNAGNAVQTRAQNVPSANTLVGLAASGLTPHANPNGGVNLGDLATQANARTPQPGTGLVDFGKVTQQFPSTGNYTTPDIRVGASVSQDPALSNRIVNGSGGDHTAYQKALDAIRGLAPNAAMAAIAKIPNASKYPRSLSLALWDTYHEQAMTPDMLSLGQIGR